MVRNKKDQSCNADIHLIVANWPEHDTQAKRQAPKTKKNTHTHTFFSSTNWTISVLIVSVNVQMEECADERLSSLCNWLNLIVYHSQQSAEPHFVFTFERHNRVFTSKAAYPSSI